MTWAPRADPAPQVVDSQAVRTISQILKKNPEKEEHPAFIYIEGEGKGKGFKEKACNYSRICHYCSYERNSKSLNVPRWFNSSRGGQASNRVLQDNGNRHQRA